MASAAEKAQCVLWFEQFKSPTIVQREYRRQFKKKPPSRSAIRRWHKQFKGTGSILDRKRSGRPTTEENVIKVVQNAFQRSPCKSLRQASMELQIPRATIH